MAARYWVGGTAAWDATVGTKWSATSGGAGGASVPTAADDVYFDGSSGVGTCTTSATSVCRSLDTAGYTGGFTLANSAVTIGDGTAGAGNIALRLNAGMTFTLANNTTSAFTFVSTSATTQTIDWGGKSVAAVNFTGVGSSYQFTSAFNGNASGSVLTHTNGTLDTNGQTCTYFRWYSTGTATRSLIFGASSMICFGNGSRWNIVTTGLTFSGASATFTFNSQNASATFGAFTYGNIVTAPGGGGATWTTNDFVCNNLTWGGASNGRYVINGNLTITGTMSSTATATNPAIIERIYTNPTCIITVNNVSGANYLNLLGITFQGAGAGFSGVGLSDGTGNSGVVFDAPRTLYWVDTNGGNWSATSSWSLSSGGPSGQNPPLVQDTVVLDSNSITVGASTININQPLIGTIDFTRLLNNPTIQFAISNGQIYACGDLTFGTNVTTSASNGTLLFWKKGGPQLIRSNGFVYNTDVSGQSNYADNLVFVDKFTQTANNTTALFNHVIGSMTANGDLELRNFNSNYNTTRTINMGSGTWFITGSSGIVFNLATATGLTLNGANATVNHTYSGGTGTRESYATRLNIGCVKVSAGTDLFFFRNSLSSATPFGDLDFTGFTGTWIQTSGSTLYTYGNVTLGTGMSISNTSGANTLSFVSTVTTQKITSNSVNFNDFNFVVNTTGSGKVCASDAFNISTTNGGSGGGILTLTAGTFDANNKNITVRTFSSSNTNARTLNLGSGTLTLTGTGTVYNTATSTNLTLTAGTSTILISDTSATAKTFAGGSKSYNNLTMSGGTGAFIVQGNNTFNSVSITTPPAMVQFTNGTTQNIFDTSGLSGAVDSYALSFTGTDYVTVANPVGLDFTNNFTLVSRFRTSQVASTGAGELYLTAKALPAGGTYKYALFAGNGNAASFALYDGTSNPRVTDPTPLTVGQDYTYIATYDGANMKLYRDGILVGTTATSIVLPTGTTEFGMGRRTGASDRWFRGLIYETIVLDTAVTAADALSIATNGFLPGSALSTNLKALFLLDTGSGAIAYDWVGANNGTIVGAAWSSGGYGNILNTLSSSTPGSQWTINGRGTSQIPFINLQDSNASPYTMYAGTNSVNSGNNTNWVFGAIPNPGGDNALMFGDII